MITLLKKYTREIYNAFVVTCFGSMLAIGILVHKDYGVSLDEGMMQDFGKSTLLYLFGQAPAPSLVDWNFHNPIIQLSMFIAEWQLHILQEGDVWNFRHLVLFLLFFGGLITFYKLAIIHSKHKFLALIGTIFFFLSPRLFSHAFNNSKDMPAMVFFSLGILTLLSYVRHPSFKNIITHAFICALTISLRPFGWLLTVLTIGCDAYTIFINRNEAASKKIALTLIAYIFTTFIFLYFIWPVLWTHPLSHLFGALSNNIDRAAGGFFNGHLSSSTPWYYTFLWIGITTPPLYSVLFIIGSLKSFMLATRKSSDMLKKNLSTTLILAWFFIPVIVGGIFMHIQQYDEWRHVLFIYPAFLLLALSGLSWLLQRGKMMKCITYCAVGLSILSTGLWMITHHPFEYAYFNLPSTLVEGRFEIDYWALSYRPAMEYILSHDKRDHIKIYVFANIAKNSVSLLPKADRDRIEFVDIDHADYILDNFRSNNYKQTLPATSAFHSMVVDGLTLLTIYKGSHFVGQ